MDDLSLNFHPTFHCPEPHRFFGNAIGAEARPFFKLAAE
jgi:hypothetical protein